MSLISCRQVTLCNNFYICLFIFINFLPVICARRANSKSSLSFAIPQFNLDTNILYEGDARPSLGLGMVELNTVSQLFRVGRFTYSQPLHLWESASGSLTDFTTHFTFMIDTLNNRIWSDGFAFFLAPVGFPIPPNSAGGNLGLFNSSTNFVPSKNQIVMVEFDSFSNEWDPTVPHVGINVNKIFSIVSTSWDFSSNKWKVANAWITYNATTKYLSATGVCPERHVISSWEFNSHLDSNEISKKTKDTERKKKLFIAATAAANGFASNGRLGQGGSGHVYKGMLQELGCTIAVKRIFAKSDYYEKIFINEDGELHGPLVSWAWQLYLARNILFAADERLERKFDQIEMECLLIIGLWCTHPNSKGRLKAGQVMKVLQLEAPLPELPHDMHESDHHLPHHHI
ncbi:hypothetical protein PS1_043228 [Malus domestica]